MRPISFKRHRFPPEVIRYAVWLYFRFTLSVRDVEELLAERGVEVSRESIRCWVIKFGPPIASNLRRRRGAPSPRWHLDEMVVKIGGRRMWLWRAVDDEGQVLDMLVQERRNKAAPLKLLRKLLRNQGIHPESITTDKLASYRAAARDLGLTDRHRPGGCCQPNGNSSPVRRTEPHSKPGLGHDRPPLRQGSGASFPVFLSADEVALLVEVVVDLAVDRGELLECFHPPEPEHRPLSSSEALV